MTKLSLLSSADMQQHLCQWLWQQRKAQKLSRQALAERSTVPAATIKKFETTGQISLRQFLLLWQSLDDLNRLAALTRPPGTQPSSIDEVLGQ